MRSAENKVSDELLEAKYIKKFELVVKIHQNSKSDYEWLKKNNLNVYEAIFHAENRLNSVWFECLAGQATVQDFERAVSAWYGANIQGIKLSAGRRIS